MEYPTLKSASKLPAGKVGMAHIGVLRAIEEVAIKIELVAGTSMGAVVGAIYAAGRIGGLAERFRAFDWHQIAGLLNSILPRSGLIDGQMIADLPLPIRAVATCIMSGEEVVCDRGDLIDAVRASISVPGIFTPMRSNGRILVDGGLVNPVPVSVVRAMGAGLVVAVDLNHDIVAGRVSRLDWRTNEKTHYQTIARLLAGLRTSPGLAQFEAWLHMEPLPGFFDVLLSSIYIMQARMTQASLQQDKPDILIRPPLGSVRFMEFDRAEEIIEIGYRSAAGQRALWAGAPIDD